jgi:hypothetical protein
MSLTLRRAGTFAAVSALAVGSSVALLAGGAGAQVDPSFSITPTSAVVGETVTLTATGCVAAQVPQDEMFVAVTVDGELIGALPTDADGTASQSVIPEAEDVGTSTFGAACIRVAEGEDDELIFEYANTITVTVTAATPTTATPMEPAEDTGAATAVAATPAFTG